MGQTKKISLWDMLSCELYKFSRNRMFIAALFIPSLLAGLAFVYMATQYRHETLGGAVAYPLNPWVTSIDYLFKFLQFTFPLIIAAICAHYFSIESNAGGGRLLHTTPYNRQRLTLVKYAVLLCAVLLSVLLAYLTFLAGIKCFTLFYPMMAFDLYDMRLPLLVFFSKILMAACWIAVIQYGLSHIAHSYLIPFVLAFLLLISSDFHPQYMDYYCCTGYLDDLHFDFYGYRTGYSISAGLIKSVIPLIIFCLHITVANGQKFQLKSYLCNR